MFVAHRLAEIVENTKTVDWHWVPGNINTADEGTKERGRLSERWFLGPTFLKCTTSDWPQEDSSEEIDESEIESPVVINVLKTTINFHQALPDIDRFSNWLRLIRATAWIRKFVGRLRVRERRKSSGLTPEEVENAEKLWWVHLQNEFFAQEVESIRRGKQLSKKSPLYRCTPMLDEDGVLRVRGRIDLVEGVETNSKNPVILPSSHRFVTLLIDYYHRKAGHHGQEYVKNELRTRYWILKLRKAVRSCWNRCISCSRERKNPFYQIMGDLPKERLDHHNRPFTNSGVDYFGPYYVSVKRSKEKRYGVLFSCLTTRAVHLEIATDLTTDGTIMAIRRMAARRGCPKVLWSDNGTNFRGAAKEISECLKSFDQEKITNELSWRGITWKFNPPLAPHMGGSWERLIRSVKVALSVTLKEKAPREEILHTLFLEAEHLVNSRPLTPVSEDPTDPESLTPNHFLIGSSSGLQPWTQEVLENSCLKKRWTFSQVLIEAFWKRWLKEYLPSLVQRTKWFQETSPIPIGQIVFITDPHAGRGNWKRGRIMATHPGKDGRVRVVDVLTSDGVFKRPVTSLLLPEADPPQGDT